MSIQYAEVGDVVRLSFAANTATGTQTDGTLPVVYIRRKGDAANAAPLATINAFLLSGAGFPDGCYEATVPTAGYTAAEYTAYCSATISALNPVGIAGEFQLIAANSGDGQLLIETTVATVISPTVFTLTDGSAFDASYPPGSHVIIGDQAVAADISPSELVSYVANTNQVTIATNPTPFVVAAGDTVRIVLAQENSGAPAAQIIGYVGGQVWLGSDRNNTGTVPYSDGTFDRPVSTLAAARAVMDALNSTLLHALPGSAITLDQAYAGYEFFGHDYAITLAGQNVSGSLIHSAQILGDDSGTNAILTCYEGCRLTDHVLGLHALVDCGIGGTITLAEAGTYDYVNVRSTDAGTTHPFIDFIGAGTKNLNMRRYAGSIELLNLKPGDNVSIDGAGLKVIINANCTGGTVVIAGFFDLEDNSGGAVTIVDTSRYNVGNISFDPAALTAIQNKTDQLTFTVPGIVDSNVQYVNDRIWLSGQWVEQ